MNLSSISTAVALSCAAHIGALAVFTHTKQPPVPDNQIVFSSALQATLLQETQDAGETLEPSVAAIEAIKNNQENKASKADKQLQNLIQQVDTLQKRLALEHTQQLALRKQLDSEKAQNIRLQQAQQSLRDQFASLQSINRLQTQKIVTLEDQTKLTVQKSQALLQQHATTLQVQQKTEETHSQLQIKNTNDRFQYAQTASLLKLREDQLAETGHNLKSLQQRNSALAKQNLSLTTKLSVFEVEHNALSDQNNNLKQHLNNVIRKNTTLTTEQKLLTERYLKLNNALDQSQITERSVSTQLQQSDTEINTLRNDHRLQLAEISVQQANVLREANATVIQENSQLRIATNALQTSLETATRNNRSLAKDRAKLRTQAQLLNRQLTELRASQKESDSVNVGQQLETKQPRADSQTASALHTQQDSKSAPDTGNAEIDFKAKQVAGNAKPVYPHIAYKLGLEGRVLIDLSMSADGAVEKVHIRDSSGSAALDSAAVRAVKKWRFYPVLLNGKAMPFTDTGHIIFKIKDS